MKFASQKTNFVNNSNFFLIFLFFFSFKESSWRNKLSFESFFVEISWEFCEIFDFDYLLGSEFFKIFFHTLEHFTYPYWIPQDLSCELSHIPAGRVSWSWSSWSPWSLKVHCLESAPESHQKVAKQVKKHKKKKT